MQLHSGAARPIPRLPLLLVLCAAAIPLLQLSLAGSPDDVGMECEPWAKEGMCVWDEENDAMRVSCDKEHNGVTPIGAMKPRHVYYNGFFSAFLRLPKTDGSSINFAWYLIDTFNTKNTDLHHAEIDMEFYGAPDHKDTTLALNVFFGGKQNLAVFKLPWDLTDHFHKYTMQWNTRFIAWLVDDSPIRIIERQPQVAHWPMQALQPRYTVWPVDYGKHPADFSSGPIPSWAKRFQLSGCEYKSANDGLYGTCPYGTSTDEGRFWNRDVNVTGLTRTPYGWVRKEWLLDNSDWGWDDATG